MADENQEVQTPEVPATPATTPATPKTATAPAAPDPASTEPAVYEYAEVPDDPGLTMALGFVGKLGFTPESPAMVAAMSGDFTFLKAQLAALGPKATGFEHYIALAEKSFKANVDSTSTKIAETAEAIHRTVGGEENWTAIKEWATANADDGEKAELNSMLNAGGFHAKAAASYLASLYGNASGTVVNPVNAAPNARGGPAPASGAPLSPTEYRSAVAALVKKHGTNGADRHPDMKVLDQRAANFRG